MKKFLSILALLWLSIAANAQTIVKISALPDASTLDGTEQSPLVQTGVTAKTTIDAIAAYTFGQGTLGVAHGGSGANTLSGLLKGNGTSAFSAAVSSDVRALWTGTCSSSTFLRGDGACAAPAAGNGTVTSVALTAPAIFSVSGSPVTTSGTLALSATGTSGGIPYFDSSTTLASSSALTNHALVVGGGAGAAPTPLASLGTTTTLLHGNAAGAPTFGAVSLSADVSGNLPVTNLNSGTSASSSTFWRGDGTWSTPAGAGTVTSVALTAPAIFSVSGSPVTGSGTLALSATGTSGGIPYFDSSTTLASSSALTANAIVLGGGAGGTPTNAGSLGTTTTVLHGNAAGAPTFGAVANADLTNSSVTINGTSVSLGGTRTLTLASSDYVNQGTTTTVLHGDAAGNPSFGAVSLTGDVTGTLAGANGGTGSTRVSFTGPSAARTYTLPDASTTVLTTNDVVTVPQGGIGAATLTGLLKGNGTSAFTAAVSSDVYALWSGTCSSSTFLRGDGACAAPAGGGTVTSVALTAPAIFSVSGSPVTGSGTLALSATGTSGGVPYFDSSTTLASSTALTNHALMLGGGVAAAPKVVGSLGTSTTVLHGAAAGDPTFAAVSLTADVSGTLPVGNGGTGITTGTSGGIPYFSSSSTIASSSALTANRIVLGGGAATSPTIVGSLGTTTTLLHGNASGAPTFGAVSLSADVSGNLPVTNLNSGTSASSSTFWRGDGTWSTPSGGGTPAGSNTQLQYNASGSFGANAELTYTSGTATLAVGVSNPATITSPDLTVNVGELLLESGFAIYLNADFAQIFQLGGASVFQLTGNGILAQAPLRIDESISNIGIDYQTFTTGFSYTFSNDTSGLNIDASGTLATGSITMPATPTDGQILEIATDQIITSLTVSPNSGQTIKNAPTTLTIGGGFSYRYRLSNTTWYRRY